METRVLTVFCTFLVCSFGAVFSTQDHRYLKDLRSTLAFRSLSFNQRSRYPLYMMQLYHSFRTADFSPSIAGNAATMQGHNSSAHSSDSVLSLMAKDCHQVGERWTVMFDMSSISTGELIQLAELRLRLPAFSASKRATVDLYHSRKRRCDPDSTSCPDEQLFLGSFPTSASSTKEGWKVFNVTALLKYWLYQGGVSSQEASGEPEVDHGSGSGDGGEAADQSLFKSLGMRQIKTHHPTTNRVMMVIFSKHNLPREGHMAYSLIHTVENSKYVTTDRASSDGQSRRHKRNRVERMRMAAGAAPTAAAVAAAEPSLGSRCQKVDMWVDFEHIGWDEWIVHPKRYNAFRCEGECPTPLDESFYPTNHAYMQSLLQHHHPERASCPSCVPTRLSPLSMLYYENEDLALRHHEEMVVEECGCH
ncbi:southpaw [Pseudoliparis swirei]|uniref:southpaw n=1 Tax=Pseudoliparis swirei TaxID=2059687 RepID=UPI0024BDF22D|nr:southpaw [Pseudoliparis swirei]